MGVCDEQCTSCRIFYLKWMRPGDSVPFKIPRFVLELGVTEIILAILVIVLASLALFDQSQGNTSPAPSFIGRPGAFLWISFWFLVDGFAKVSVFKRKTRYSAALALASSCFATLLLIGLLACVTMAISQEVKFQSNTGNATGTAISSVTCALITMLLIVTLSSSLMLYMSVTSHDNRWFTDRGIQHDSLVPSSGDRTSLSVPSSQPALIFYAPSTDGLKYSSAFENIMKDFEEDDKLRIVKKASDKIRNKRKTSEFSDDAFLEATEAYTNASHDH
ncbi:uncharacterized protein LOC143465568 [Clavelina lepadiformis]|uniref:uncharacterized protein LOC143465568 n=1 Tax=Clavelina lepadiformis TaxID=159417 RepID=UPI00404221E4